MLILIITSMLLIVLILLETIKHFKVNTNLQNSDHEWMNLINNFKKVSPLIKTTDQLEHYLTDINEQVKNYETDYSFLVAFNSIVREVRARLMQQD